VAEEECSSERFREEAADRKVEAVILHPANQRTKEKGLPRVDEPFRTHGPTRER